jgi:hypothetical protein
MKSIVSDLVRPDRRPDNRPRRSISFPEPPVGDGAATEATANAAVESPPSPFADVSIRDATPPVQPENVGLASL